MPLPALLAVVDTDEPFKLNIYLPGEPVPGCRDSLCPNCDEFADTIKDPVTGFTHRGEAAAGFHHGIIGVVYSPMPGGGEGECEYWHLRCQIETCTELKAAGMIIGEHEINQGDDAKHRRES
jgi:hypothetical protein